PGGSRGLRGPRPTTGSSGLLGDRLAAFFAYHDHWRVQRAQLAFDLCRRGGVFLQPGARVLLALADAVAVVAVPGTGLVHQLGVHAHVDDLALAADALAIQDL